MRQVSFYIAIVLLFFCTVSNAQQGQENFDNSIIWEIRKTKKSKPSYILGSIHIMDTTKLNFPIKKLEKLLDGCKVLCTEIIYDEANAKEFADKIMLSNQEKNIINTLEPDYYNRLLEILNASKRELNLFKDERVLRVIRPSVLALMITMDKQSNSVLFENNNFSPEKHFGVYAKERNYSINQLETIQEQVLMLSYSTFEEEIEALKKIIDENSKDPIDIYLQYQKQDLRLLSPEVYADSTMVTRNKKMADGIESLINEKKRAFVMIGAAHLPYETGVLNLLLQKGYVIKPYALSLYDKE